MFLASLASYGEGKTSQAGFLVAPFELSATGMVGVSQGEQSTA